MHHYIIHIFGLYSVFTFFHRFKLELKWNVKIDKMDSEFEIRIIEMKREMKREKKYKMRCNKWQWSSLEWLICVNEHILEFDMDRWYYLSELIIKIGQNVLHLVTWFTFMVRQLSIYLVDLGYLLSLGNWNNVHFIHIHAEFYRFFSRYWVLRWKLVSIAIIYIFH